MIRLPGQFGWRKDQDSDVSGSFVGGMNLDFLSNMRHLRISPRMKIGTDDITNLGVATGFVRFNGGSGQNGFFTVAGDRAFSTSSVDASVAFAASSGSSTDHSTDTADVFFFKKANKLITTRQTDYQYHDGASWANAGGGPHFTSGTVHMMTEYGNLLYVTDNYKRIHSIDTSMSITSAGSGSANTFNLGTLDTNNLGLVFSLIMAGADRIWLFTINAAVGLPARVFTWDGATGDTPTNSQGYILDSGGVWAAILIGDTPYIINTEARLQTFNGQTFQDVQNGRLPFRKDKFLKNAFSSLNDRPIHPRGLVLLPGNRLRVFINNVYEDSTIDEFSPAGVYEFQLGHPELGWYHVSTPSLYVSSISDYGQSRVSRVGGIAYAKTPTGKGTLLLGAQLYSDASTTKEVIEYDDTDDTIQKYGYIVTTKFYSDSLKDNWTKVVLRFKKLLDSGDSIVVKYRTTEVDSTEATITWSDTNTFTTTTDLSAYAIGDEVEILQGTGGVKCAHITAISANAGTYTVDLDDTFTGASGTAKARVQKWIKIASCTDQTVQSFDPGIPMATSEWIQFKICLQFKGKDEFDDVTPINASHQ